MTSPAIGPILKLYAVLVCLFSVAPVAVVVLESFTASDYIVFPPQGLSLKWYFEIVKRPQFAEAALVSLWVAIVAATVSTLLGIVAGLVLTRDRFPGRAVVRALFMAPLSVPGLIIGLALLQFLVLLNAPRNILGLMVGHVIITTPFAIRFITVAVLGLPEHVERAAQSLGASPLRTFYLVVFPLIRPGIAASLLFAFIISFDEVAVSLFLSSPQATTLPVRMYTYIDQNYDPLVTAISTILVAIAVGAALVMERIVGLGRAFGLR